jgi:diguanylate cyclase (GGDEF)-like protein/PAS domain S-box-containing protein
MDAPVDAESVNLQRRLDRERRARREAETIAEDSLRQVYDTVRELQQSRAVLDETPDFVIIADLDGRARYLNHALLELLGLDPDDAPNVNAYGLLTEASRERVRAEGLAALNLEGVWRADLAMLGPMRGSDIPVSYMLIGHRGPTGVLDSMSSIARDITEILAMEERLTHLALHDPLTGLPNRRLFFDRLDGALARAARIPTPIGVFLLDIDDFKLVNDDLGHEAGDQLLVAIAERLTGCVRASDTVCRLGGDEFCVLVEQIADEGEALRMATRLGQSVAQTIRLGDRDFRMNLSIGVVLATAALDGSDVLLRQADAAMYEAKRLGKGRVHLFAAG